MGPRITVFNEKLSGKRNLSKKSIGHIREKVPNSSKSNRRKPSIAAFYHPGNKKSPVVGSVIRRYPIFSPLVRPGVNRLLLFRFHQCGQLFDFPDVAG